MDYTRIAQVAERLIAGNGRLINIIKISTTPSDPAKPWRPELSPRDEEEVANVRAAFVEPSSLVRFGFKSEEDDMGTRRIEQVALIAARSLGSHDLTEYDEIQDAATRYKIGLIRRIAPADIPILYMVGVRR